MHEPLGHHSGYYSRSPPFVEELSLMKQFAKELMRFPCKLMARYVLHDLMLQMFEVSLLCVEMLLS